MGFHVVLVELGGVGEREVLPGRVPVVGEERRPRAQERHPLLADAEALGVPDARLEPRLGLLEALVADGAAGEGPIDQKALELREGRGRGRSVLLGLDPLAHQGRRDVPLHLGDHRLHQLAVPAGGVREDLGGVGEPAERRIERGGLERARFVEHGVERHALALLRVALRPHHRQQDVQPVRRGVELAAAEVLQDGRVARLGLVLAELLEQLPGDRVGLPGVGRGPLEPRREGGPFGHGVGAERLVEADRRPAHPVGQALFVRPAVIGTMDHEQGDEPCHGGDGDQPAQRDSDVVPHGWKTSRLSGRAAYEASRFLKSTSCYASARGPRRPSTLGVSWPLLREGQRT